MRVRLAGRPHARQCGVLLSCAGLFANAAAGATIPVICDASALIAAIDAANDQSGPDTLRDRRAREAAPV
jgi:hypothetical protein